MGKTVEGDEVMFLFGIYADYDKEQKRKELMGKARVRANKSVLIIGSSIQDFEKERVKRKSGIKFSAPRFSLWGTSYRVKRRRRK